MSQENVEMVRAAYEAMSRGDWDAAFEEAEPDVELVPPDRSPSQRAREGHGGGQGLGHGSAGNGRRLVG